MMFKAVGFWLLAFRNFSVIPWHHFLTTNPTREGHKVYKVTFVVLICISNESVTF